MIMIIRLVQACLVLILCLRIKSLLGGCLEIIIKEKGRKKRRIRVDYSLINKLQSKSKILSKEEGCSLIIIKVKVRVRLLKSLLLEEEEEDYYFLNWIKMMIINLFNKKSKEEDYLAIIIIIMQLLLFQEEDFLTSKRRKKTIILIMIMELEEGYSVIIKVLLSNKVVGYLRNNYNKNKRKKKISKQKKIKQLFLLLLLKILLLEGYLQIILSLLVLGGCLGITISLNKNNNNRNKEDYSQIIITRKKKVINNSNKRKREKGLWLREDCSLNQLHSQVIQDYSHNKIIIIIMKDSNNKEEDCLDNRNRKISRKKNKNLQLLQEEGYLVIINLNRKINRIIILIKEGYLEIIIIMKLKITTMEVVYLAQIIIVAIRKEVYLEKKRGKLLPSQVEDYLVIIIVRVIIHRKRILGCLPKKVKIYLITPKIMLVVVLDYLVKTIIIINRKSKVNLLLKIIIIKKYSSNRKNRMEVDYLDKIIIIMIINQLKVVYSEITKLQLKAQEEGFSETIIIVKKIIKKKLKYHLDYLEIIIITNNNKINRMNNRKNSLNQN